ncbi:MAG: hypothetical protein Q8Q18_02705 [bacterium]|nr:hypothetical protein [bacterium]
MYDHIGEGNYEETEQAIQEALRERALRIGMEDTISTELSKPAVAVSVESNKMRSPEVYFGSSRNEYLANGPRKIGSQTPTVPFGVSPNRLYFCGERNMAPEHAESESASTIVFEYKAKKVYMAAGSLVGMEIEVYKDNVFVKK